MRSKRGLNTLLSTDRKTLYMVLSIVMVSVLTLTVVYAALSTTLNITGNAEVTAANWDIHFDNIQVNPASVTATTAPTKTDARTINFAVTLTQPGDFYKFSVDIVNNGSIDAMIDSIVKTPELTAEQAKYIKYEIEYTDGNAISSKQILPKNETKTISVLVSYRSDIIASDLPSSATSLDLSFKAVYTQADSTGTAVPEGAEIKLVSGDLDTIGSEVAIGDEHFYVLSNDGRNVTMLSKYNLHVGNSVADDTWATTPLENPTGKQDATAIGGQSDSDGNSKFPFIGTVAYSTTNYWWDSTASAFNSNYNSGYTLDGNFFPYVYDSNSTAYTYVNNYKTYLEGLGVTVNEARLINIEELLELGCTPGSCTEAPEWVYGTSYWTGSAISSTFVWRVDSVGSFNYIHYSFDLGLGVRPVISISLSDF